MHIIPVIEKILKQDDVFYALNKDDEILFATQYQEIANMYYAIPDLLEEQAKVIFELQEKLNELANEYNQVIMGLIPSGSSYLH